MRPLLFGLVCVLLVGCASPEGVAVPGRDGAVKTAASDRAERRLFDGAPPVIPHEQFSAGCVSCHNTEGLSVPDVGYSPPSPHVETVGMSAISRCRQCHVQAGTTEAFVANSFVGLRQDLRRGSRLTDQTPPVIPHQVFMRENCLACHTGPAAREEIRTTHPERVRCRQCHVERVSTAVFGAGGP